MRKDRQYTAPVRLSTLEDYLSCDLLFDFFFMLN